MSNNNSNNSKSSSSSDDDSDSGEQVRVALQLAPDCADRSLALDGDLVGAIAVPADVGRRGLSAVVNHLLDRQLPKSSKDEEKGDHADGGDDDDRLPAIPFDFIVGGPATAKTAGTRRLLRTGIEREARRSGLTLEEAIPVTYFPAQLAPELEDESQQLPDWIAALQFVTTNHENLLCSGCYDGSLHVFRAKLTVSDPSESSKDSTTMTLENVATKLPERPGAGAIKSLAAAVDQEQQVWLAAGSTDHSLRLYQIHTDTFKLKLHAECTQGHSAAVSTVDLWCNSNNNSSQKYLASGDWDGAVVIWDAAQKPTTATTPEEEQPVVKKTKTSSSSSSKASSSEAGNAISPTLSPKLSWQAHSSKVSGVAWGNYEKINSSSSSNTELPRHLVTGSWDHSLKVWDVERQDCLLTLNGSRVVSCLDTSYHSSGIVATGHPDCTVRLWDMRTGSDEDKKEASNLVKLVSDQTFRPSHKEWITSVQWSRHNPYHLASTSHDGTVKLWDIRSPLPLHTVRAFDRTQKGLSLVYGPGAYIFAGGTDCIVKQFRCGPAAGMNVGDKENKQ